LKISVLEKIELALRLCVVDELLLLQHGSGGSANQVKPPFCLL
jgi:hypothetical protein